MSQRPKKAGRPISVYTPEIIQRIKELAPNNNAAQVGKELGIPRDSIYSYCTREGIILKNRLG
jgi:hypothetical protein